MKMWRTSSDNGHFESSEVHPLLPNACSRLIYSVTEKGTEQRNTFLLPKDSAGSPSEASSSGHTNSKAPSQNPPTKASPSQNQSAGATTSHVPSTETIPSQDPSARATPSQGPRPRPSRPQKSAPQCQPPTSMDTVQHLQPKSTSTPQAAVTSDISQDTPTPTSPMPDVPIDPPADVPDLDEDMDSTTTDACEPPSQVEIVPQVGSPNTAERSKVPTEIVPMDTRPDSTVTPIPSQSLTKVANTTSDVPTPGVPYKVRNTTTAHSGGRSRRGSIDGAPEMFADPIDEEITVDLRDYINLDSDDETHVSSSQKTADEGRELSPPPPNSQQRQASLKSSEDHTSQPKSVSTRTLPQLDVDQEDFPAWMMKKGQWRYLTSTAGGTAWEHLLKVYINQERRLEFTEKVSDLDCTFPNQL